MQFTTRDALWFACVIAIAVPTAMADGPHIIRGSEGKAIDNPTGNGWRVSATGGDVAASNADLRDTAFRDGYLLGYAAGSNGAIAVASSNGGRTSEARFYQEMADAQSGQFGSRAKQWSVLDWSSILNPWRDRPGWLRKIIQESKALYDAVPARVRARVRQVDLELSQQYRKTEPSALPTATPGGSLAEGGTQFASTRACQTLEALRAFESSPAGQPRTDDGYTTLRGRCAEYMRARGFEDNVCFPQDDDNRHPICPKP